MGIKIDVDFHRPNSRKLDRWLERWMFIPKSSVISNHTNFVLRDSYLAGVLRNAIFHKDSFKRMRLEEEYGAGLLLKILKSQSFISSMDKYYEFPEFERWYSIFVKAFECEVSKPGAKNRNSKRK